MNRLYTVCCSNKISDSLNANHAKINSGKTGAAPYLVVFHCLIFLFFMNLSVGNFMKLFFGEDENLNCSFMKLHKIILT